MPFYVNKFIKKLQDDKYIPTQQDKDLIEKNEALKETTKLIIEKTFMQIFNQLNVIKWFLGIIDPGTLNDIESEIKVFQNQYLNLSTKLDNYTRQNKNLC